jgi:multiple sugar transport system permease protein
MSLAPRVLARPAVARGRRRIDPLPYAFLAPSLIALGVVILYPIVRSILLSFQNANLLLGGGLDQPFIGFRNYTRVLSSLEFFSSLRVTLVYTVLGVAGSYVLGLCFALLVAPAFRGRALMRALLIAPWAMPPVVTSIVWLWMYDPQFGVVNFILQQLHLIGGNVAWLANPFWALPSVIAVTIWKNTPLAMVVLLAGLQSIPSDLYEAARIDGAGRFSEFRYVTLPGLRPVSAVLVLMLTLWVFKEFTYVYVLTGGGPGQATETLVFQVYEQAFKRLDFGIAAATGVMVMLMCLVFALIYIPAVQRGEAER